MICKIDNRSLFRYYVKIILASKSREYFNVKLRLGEFIRKFVYFSSSFFFYCIKISVFTIARETKQPQYTRRKQLEFGQSGWMKG